MAACSALRRAYRDYLIQETGSEIFFIHLSGTKEVILSRMLSREGHFMPSQLLDSQFATLETLQDDEVGITVDVQLPVEQIVEQCFQAIMSPASVQHQTVSPA